MEPITGYEPDETIPMQPPTLRGGPVKALGTVGSLVWQTLWPYGFVYIGLAAVVWNFFTPAMDRMQRFAFGWIAEIYLRNVVLLLVSAGGLHLWLYVRRAQGKQYKYDDRWLSTKTRRFLWGSQTRDNMFWALISGAFFWTAYEALLLWAYANDHIGRVDWGGGPTSVIYLAVMTVVPFFLVTGWFYVTHRLLHTGLLYRRAHYLHHKNVNTGPWSGLSMHPVEHLLYFSAVLFFLLIPVSPFVVILTNLFTAMDPARGHCGFDRFEIGYGRTMPAGTYFHDLHHKYFECKLRPAGDPDRRLDGHLARRLARGARANAGPPGGRRPLSGRADRSVQ